MADELVDVVDEDGVVFAQAMKSKTHRDGLLHKTVVAVVRRGDGWALVKQADDRQDAGQLVSPVGGHVQAGESHEEALIREAEEEIGLTPDDYELVGVARFHRTVIGRDENHLFVLYEIRTHKPFVLNHEAVAVEEFTDAELMRALIDEPERFGDAFFFVMKEFYPDYSLG